MSDNIFSSTTMGGGVMWAEVVKIGFLEDYASYSKKKEIAQPSRFCDLSKK